MNKKYALPAGVRIYAIGDVHGCFHSLKKLYAMIKQDQKRRPVERAQIVLLGDLSDYGPNSKQVIDFLIEQRETALDSDIVTMGNHEDKILKLIKGKGQDRKTWEDWYVLGGWRTIQSYDDTKTYNHFLIPDPDILEIIPPEHVHFMETFKTSWTCGDYFFSHACPNLNEPLGQQRPVDLMGVFNNVNNPFSSYNGPPPEKKIIHGHEFRHDFQPDENAFRIGIDTGACYIKGQLTCIVIEGEGHHYMQIPTQSLYVRGANGVVPAPEFSLI